MTLASRRGRRGFTLVELMVAMGIVAFVAGLGMLVVPNILERNRTVDAVTQVEGWLQNARVRAMRDKLPRGVRFIVNNNNPLVTEAQYIESPPIVPVGDGPGNYPLYSPRVVFTYGLDAQNQINNRVCTIQNLTDPDQTGLATAGSVLIMPVIGTTHVITASSGRQAQTPASGLDTSKFSVTVTLDQYPDAQMGAGTSLTTYHFGLSGAPRPLMGSPVMQLPERTCVDLTQNVSVPGWTGSGDYDVLFAPSGQTIAGPSNLRTGSVGQIFLWVRDWSKVPSMEPVGLGWANYPIGPAPQTYLDALKRGGEQMIIVVKAKSGGIGAAPVYWPDAANSDVYYNARKAVSGP